MSSLMSPEIPSPVRAASHQTDRAWLAWCERVSAGIPALAARIFALRAGRAPELIAQWELERRLGRIVTGINDRDPIFPSADPASERFILRRLAFSLHYHLAKAERANLEYRANPMSKLLSPDAERRLEALCATAEQRHKRQVARGLADPGIRASLRRVGKGSAR